MAGSISFQTKFLPLSPRLAQFCKDFNSITFRGINPGIKRAEAILDAFRGLSSLNPDQSLAKKFTLDVPYRLASIDALFNPATPGHRLDLEIWHNNVEVDGIVRNELVAMRWITLRDIRTKKDVTLGAAFILTGEIEKLLE